LPWRVVPEIDPGFGVKLPQSFGTLVELDIGEDGFFEDAPMLGFLFVAPLVRIFRPESF
jgi:hypothetical protein